MRPVNVFVIGLDENNLRTLERVPGAERYRFHGLLTVPEIQYGEIPIEDLLHKAQDVLDSFDGEIGAIVGYWDFPATAMVPLLCRRYGLPSADLEAVLKCEHKYWSRLEQREVVDNIPKFGLVDLDGPPRLPDGMKYPVWLKPVKSFSSELAFHVKNDEDLVGAVEEIRDGVGRVGKPFQFVLDQVELPAGIAEIGGQACLAEEALNGVQAATEGYVHNGRVTVNGALDSINYPGTPCFLRHQYPSQLPAELVERMTTVSERVMERVGLNNSTFSIEFFVDPEAGTVSVLEINARHSQSHAEMFEYVDGVPNHHCMVQLGLGGDPRLPRGEGPYEIAAKWSYRRFGDAVVTRVPTAAEIDALQERIPGVTIDLVPAEGSRLSDLPAQDSYSYELADLFIGAADETELKSKYESCVAALRFEFDDEEE